MPILPIRGTAVEALGPGARAGKRREDLRDSIWPDAEKLIWNRKSESGFCTLPRTIPLINSLINQLSPKGKGDASRVYNELWFRAFDEGFIIVVDEQSHAYAAGYDSPRRGLRSWRERMDVLVDLGFIKISQDGLRKYGYVLLVHPDIAVESLRKKKKISDNWYNAYTKRMIEIGARRTKKPII